MALSTDGGKPAESNVAFHSSVDRALMAILPLYCLTTLLQNVPGLAYVNRFLVAPVFLLALASLFRARINKWYYMAIAVLSAVSVIACAFTQWNSYAVVQAPRGIFCIVLVICFCARFDSYRAICQQNTRYFQAIAFLWTVLVAISIPLPSSWSIQWGGSPYFVSYVDSAFQLMPTAMIVMALNIICTVQGQRKIVGFVLSLVPLYAGLQGGSRTYFVLIVAMFFALLLTMRLTKFERRVLIVVVAAAILVSFSSSGIAEKLLNVTSEQQRAIAGSGVLGTFTSGRSDFWLIDIQAFFDLPLWQQFVGNGYSFSYNVNAAGIGNAVFAHNDFINLLMESGYIGLRIYLSVMISFFVAAKRKAVSKSQITLLVFIWFFNAFSNSFYPYVSSVIAFCLTGVAFSLSAVKHREENGR